VLTDRARQFQQSSVDVVVLRTFSSTYVWMDAVSNGLVLFARTTMKFEVLNSGYWIVIGEPKPDHTKCEDPFQRCARIHY
jgi:hypothetical protein